MYNKIYRNMRFLCILTLILSSALLLAVSYTFIVSSTKNNLENQAVLVADILNNSSVEADTLKSISGSSKLGYTLISSDGKIIFSSDKNTASYEKGIYYFNAKLNSGNILRCTKSFSDIILLFYPAIILMLLMIIFIYILSSHIASKLTANIVKPITQQSAHEYDEIRPLTERIELQNKEIKRQIEYAKAQKLQLQLITDSMNEGLVVVDETGNIISINSFASNIFNVREYEVRNKSYLTLTDNEIFKNAVSEALNKRRSSALIEMGDIDYRIFCSPVIKKENFSGVIILLFDVTSTSQSERLRREFSANVSHELKTPLTSINGYAQIIANGIATEKDIPDFAKKIAKESNRLMILIEDIIRLSNLDEGMVQENEKSTFSLKEVIYDVISSLQEKADSKNIIIRCDGTDFNITAHKTQINELIYNLLDNAIKYNKDNGFVNFTLYENNLTVSDSGIGIANEYIGRIFERFFRVDKSHSKKVDGTGLGLSIVKHIAKQNNIDIEVKSTPDVGTTFLLTFCI